MFFDADQKWFCLEPKRADEVAAKLVNVATEEGVETAFHSALTLAFDWVLQCEHCSRLLYGRNNIVLATFQPESTDSDEPT